MPRDLATITLKCLAKQPARRYATARDLADDLRRWLTGHTIRARPVTAPERLWRWSRRNPALSTVSAGLAVALVIGGVLLTSTGRRLSRSLHREQRSVEQQLNQSQYGGLLVMARQQLLSGQQGQRFETLRIIRRAAQIAPTAELRDEAAAALAMADLTLETNSPAIKSGLRGFLGFTPDFKGYFLRSP